MEKPLKPTKQQKPYPTQGKESEYYEFQPEEVNLKHRWIYGSTTIHPDLIPSSLKFCYNGWPRGVKYPKVVALEKGTGYSVETYFGDADPKVILNSCMAVENSEFTVILKREDEVIPKLATSPEDEASIFKTFEEAQTTISTDKEIIYYREKSDQRKFETLQDEKNHLIAQIEILLSHYDDNEVDILGTGPSKVLLEEDEFIEGVMYRELKLYFFAIAARKWAHEMQKVKDSFTSRITEEGKTRELEVVAAFEEERRFRERERFAKSREEKKKRQRGDDDGEPEKEFKSRKVEA
ncbi:hypothetical protein HYALB_00006040 [Hymenoscyphus albidus]|uniref:Uncharacterized protein n=1 Tax=Hymenoscyphus albidus TaxID=595503 RepID=A0A9N9M0W4_9HELO|nr:hypothetical protein HYALB_00006040 [Hymenoscyphus albidus]